jgi:Ser/Thr protein kinase RdoA (MazF antagonist)
LVVLHGNYKAENMCFSADRGDDDLAGAGGGGHGGATAAGAAAAAATPRCAVFDFQWAGAGAPAVDVVYLLFTSLGELMGQHGNDQAEQLLNYYHTRLGVHGVDIDDTFDRAMLQRQYEWALLDFARFALGDGAMLQCDLGWVHRCVALLSAVPSE